MTNPGAPWYRVVIVEGAEQGDLDVSDRVVTFVFEDNERQADKLKLTVENFKLQNFDNPVFERGRVLRVEFGNGTARSPIREMVIRRVVGSTSLTIEARDQGVELDTLPKCRVFENRTRSQVVREIAREQGYADPIIDETDEVFEVISQASMSDAQFLRKLAHLEGFQFYVDFDGLHWHERRVGRPPLRELTYYVAKPSAGDILLFNIESDVTRKPGKVTVAGFDPLEQTPVEAVATNDTDTDRSVLQSLTATVNPETGALEVQEGASLPPGSSSAGQGAPVATTTSASSVVPQSSRVAFGALKNSNVQSQADVEVEARRRYRLAAQRAVKLSLTLRGLPDFLAKSVILVTGLGTKLSGRYWVKSCVHTISGQSGYKLTAKCITDGFQRQGKKGGAAEADAQIQSCIAALGAARSGLPPTLLGAYDAFVTRVAALGGLGNTELSKGAAAAANQGVQLVAQLAAVGAGGPGGAVQGCVGGLRTLIGVDGEEAKGKVNDLEPSDPNQLTPVVTLDPETGLPQTVYRDTRGR
jgi:phage protein D